MDILLPLLKAFAPNSTDSSITKLNAIYQYCENIINSSPKKPVCKSGCFHCCNQKVVLAPIEITNIKNNLDTFKPRNNGDYCPLLDLSSGKCGMYNFRPLVCRAMLAFDNPDLCENGSTHTIFTASLLHTQLTSTLSHLNHPDSDALLNRINNFLFLQDTKNIHDVF